MEEMSGLMPLNLRDSEITMPTDLTAGHAARVEAFDVDDQIAALHESGHAVLATVAATPSFPVSSIDIKSRTPRIDLTEGDDNMPRWHRATRFKALIVVCRSSRRHNA